MDTAVYDYEKIYFDMWETARRYSELIQFRVIGKSHDDRMIPMVEMGQGEDCIFCVSGIYGYDRLMPVLLLEMIWEYARAWECNWKLEEIYDAGELLKKWRFCFIPLLNPDGYEIYKKDYFVIRNPIYRQMLRMGQIPCKEFGGNGRGIDLGKNFPTSYYRRNRISQQPASENETKALVRIFQEYRGRGLLSFCHSGKKIVYFKQSQKLLENQKSHRLARHLQKMGDFSMEKYQTDTARRRGSSVGGSPEQFYTEIIRQPSFRIELPVAREITEENQEAQFREIHTLPLEFAFSL